MNFPSFLFFTTIGSAVWTTFLAGAGYVLKNNFTDIEKYLDPFVYIILAVIVILYLVRVIRYKHPQASE